MIALIVNADDLGIGPERDRGILEAFEHGLVTGSTLLANGDSFATAVSLAKEAGLPVGVHLNLSSGSPITGPIAGLTEADGRFPGKVRMREALAAGLGDPAALRTELAAQIERVFTAGLTPDHLDSHQHCQLYPQVGAVIAELAREYGIPALRRPVPAEPAEEDPDGILGTEMASYRHYAAMDDDRLHAGLARPDGLWGMPLLDRLDTPSLCACLERLPTGRWELMTHPGYPSTGGSAFESTRRVDELRALCAPEAREVVVRRGIRLITFGDLACMS